MSKEYLNEMEPQALSHLLDEINQFITQISTINWASFGVGFLIVLLIGLILATLCVVLLGTFSKRIHSGMAFFGILILIVIVPMIFQMMAFHRYGIPYFVCQDIHQSHKNTVFNYRSSIAILHGIQQLSPSIQTHLIEPLKNAHRQESQRYEFMIMREACQLREVLIEQKKTNQVNAERLAFIQAWEEPQ